MKKLLPLLFCASLIACTKASVDTPYPIVSDNVCALENIHLSEYLNQAEEKYTDSNWTTVSIINDSTKTKIWGSSSNDRRDFPAPAELSWNVEIDTSILCIYTNKTCTELVRLVKTAKKSAQIYNLIPERTYFYTVSDKDGKIHLGGNLVTKGRRRMLRVSTVYDEKHANNCRDLGGLPTVDGKTLKYGLIYRGSRMDEATDAEKLLLTQELGIKMDMDLRKDGVNAFSDTKWGVRYSLSTYGSWSGQNKLYDLNYGPNIKHTFTDLIEAVTTSSPVYIHCSAGADRTGYICLLLEAALGVSQKDCSIDYELTSFSVVGARDRKCATTDYYFKSGMTYIQDYSKGNTFQQKAENILLDAGITADMITSFKNAMLD